MKRRPEEKKLTPEEELRLVRRKLLIFEPVYTKEALQKFLAIFFHIQLPDCKVDEESTSTPMDFLWDVYSTMATNIGPKRYVVAASRNSAKTLVSSLLHLLAMIHFRRTCVHIAATRDQSGACIRYMNKFCRIPELRDHFESENAKEKVLVNLPPNSYTAKSDAKITVVAATAKSANAQRGNLIIKDEIDQTSREVLAEVAGVLDPTLDEHNFGPIAIGLSSRKSNEGPLQDDLDLAEEEELCNKPRTIRVIKFSVVDWMAKCKPETHGDEELIGFVSTNNLETRWGEHALDNETELTKSEYRKVHCWKNCKTCPAFVICLGRSPKQQSTSPRLRNIDAIATIIQEVKDVNIIIAQYLNWRPETTGLVYQAFNSMRHVKSPQAVYEWISDKVWPNSTIQPTKEFLYKWMIEHGWIINYGVDFGYNPDPATCAVVAYHPQREQCVVLSVVYKHGYDNKSWAKYVAKTYAPTLHPDLVCPDTQDPAAIGYFMRLGLSAVKKPARIETGVSQIRGLLFNPSDQREHFCVLNDGSADMQHLVKEFTHWKHKKHISGSWDTSQFEKGNDHGLDAIRYALNPHTAARGKLTLGNTGQPVNNGTPTETKVHNAIQQTYSENGAPNAFNVDLAKTQLRNAGLGHLIDEDINDDKPKKAKIKFRL